MREIILQINFWEAEVREQEKFIKDLQRGYDELKNEPLLKYIGLEKVELIKLKMNYIGMVRAWLDTLPSNILCENYNITEKDIKNNLIMYFEKEGEYILDAFAYGYYRVIYSLAKDNGFADNVILPGDVLQSIKDMSLSNDSVKCLRNLYKYIGKNNKSLYDKLSIRESINEEIKKIRIVQLSDNY